MFSIMSMQSAIGVLDRANMEHFANIFVLYQKLGKSNDAAGPFHISVLHGSSRCDIFPEIRRLQAALAPWTSSTSRGNLRANSNNDGFSIK